MAFSSWFDRVKAFFGGSIARGGASSAPQKSGIVEAVTNILTAGQQKDIDVLARTLWGEARGEGVRGMHAVANVIMRRHSLRKYGQGWPSFGPVAGSVAQIAQAPSKGQTPVAVIGNHKFFRLVNFAGV